MRRTRHVAGGTLVGRPGSRRDRGRAVHVATARRRRTRPLPAADTDPGLAGDASRPHGSALDRRDVSRPASSREPGGAAGGQPDARLADQRRPLPLRLGRAAAGRRRRPVPLRAGCPAAGTVSRRLALAGRCHLRRLHKPLDHQRPAHACTRINRPSVRTIYPPAAEGYFLAAHWLPGPPRDHRLQLDAADPVGRADRTAGVRPAAHRPRSAAGGVLQLRPDWPVSTSPPTPMSTCSAALFGVGADPLATLKPRARARAGWLVGLAIAVKLYPGAAAARAAAPAADGAARCARAAAVGVVAVGYLPHVIAVGGHVLGYLPGYLHEERLRLRQRVSCCSALLGLARRDQGAGRRCCCSRCSPSSRSRCARSG